MTKSIASAWVAGTGQGMLDTGSVGNSNYYIYLIGNPTTGAGDYISSLAAPSVGPALPSGFTRWRAAGWFIRVGGANVAFTTYETEGGGLSFAWTTPTLDINLAATLTSSRRTDAPKVPLNIPVIAEVRINLLDTNAAFAWVGATSEADVAVSISAAPLFTHSAPASNTMGRVMFIRTSAAGLIGARASEAIDTYNAVTVGFRWERRI
jgi:hypothetical protein